MFNLTQISGTAGQQSVRGGRIYNGYIERPLPHFKRNDLGGKAHGFIDSNYFAGFDPIDFFFNAMGGREGLVDKGARTPRSGYTQRKLVNALLDISVKDNEMVTDNRGIIIQRVFGEDGVNPSKTEDGKIADLDKIIDEMRAK
jgi:DNA-directed RNA polymerase subunit A'